MTGPTLNSTQLAERESFTFPTRPVARAEKWIGRVCAAAGLLTTFAICAEYGWSHLPGLWILFVPAALLAWVVWRRPHQRQRATLSVDWRARTFEWTEYRFATSASGSDESLRQGKLVEREVVRFDDITGVETVSANLGTGGFALRTADDWLEVSEELERFSVFTAHVERVLGERGIGTAGLQRALAHRPPAPAPWWGWLLLFGGVGLVVLIAWVFMYTDLLL